MDKWDHDALADDLAAHLKAPGRMVWTNMQLGRSGSPRPDVYAIAKSYAHPNPVAYEVKISREDFRADVTTGKWSAYLEYAYGVLFAVPAGLVDKREVPEICGLIVRHEKVWRLAKRPTLNMRPIDQGALLKLLIDGVHREGPRMRAERWHNGDATREFAKKFGAAAARYVCDAASLDTEIEVARLRAERIVADAERHAKELREKAVDNLPERWSDLCRVLSLDPGASLWSVESAIRRLHTEAEGGTAAQSLRRVLNQLERIVDNERPREETA